MKQGLKSIGLSIAVLLVGAGLFVTGASAQDTASAPPSGGQQQGPPPGGGRGGMRMSPEMRASMLQKQLGLTDDVTAQVKSIFAAGTEKMQALRSNDSLSMEDRRTQMQAIHSDEVTKVKALLTPDQQTKYAELEAQQQQRGPRPGGGPPPQN